MDQKYRNRHKDRNTILMVSILLWFLVTILPGDGA
jgi:hypothetical protein